MSRVARDLGLISESLKNLHYAVSFLEDVCIELNIMMPRPRTFSFVRGSIWPIYSNLGLRCYPGIGNYWTYIKFDNVAVFLKNKKLPEELYQRCGGRPRKVENMLRRIESAERLCFKIAHSYVRGKARKE